MTKALNKDSIFNDEQYTCSSYNEDTNEELDYFIDESNCYVGDTAYLYSKEDDALYEMKIEHIIKRSDNVKFYDSLIENDNVLLEEKVNLMLIQAPNLSQTRTATLYGLTL